MRLKVHIPGDHIVLTKPWTFKLYAEHRNSALHKWAPATGTIAGAVTWQDELYGGLGYYWDNPATGRREIRHIDVTLPAGTELQFDRVYIRNRCGRIRRVSDRVYSSVHLVCSRSPAVVH